MIPILYPNDIKPTISKKGIGVLVDVASCVVTEERNGIFELKMQYPVDGMHFNEIEVDRLILAKTSQIGTNQLFRIYNVTKPMDGIVTVSAEHVSYMLSNVIVEPFEAYGPKNALASIKENSLFVDLPFDFRVDYEDEDDLPYGSVKPKSLSSARSLLGGAEGSILDSNGGEYEFDNFNVIWHKNRGKDNGVVIAYAKNLTGFKCQEKSDGIVTGVWAFWNKKDDKGNVTSTAEAYYSVDNLLSYPRDVVLDCSGDFEEHPDQQQLLNKAKKYVQSHKNAPYYSITVEFVNLGDTEEYKQFKDLEKVSLCDIVTVRNPIYNIDVKEKVVKTTYDSLAEKYVKIDIGSTNRIIY